MKQLSLSIAIFLFFQCSGVNASAQSCPGCPPVFQLADSVGCHEVDISKVSPVVSYYTPFTPISACKDSRMKYTLTADAGCFPTLTYSFVSISGGTLISFINNQFVIQWGNSNTGNILIAFATPPGPGITPCRDTISLSFNILNTPFAAFTAAPQPACFNNPTNISFNSSASLNAVNYYWNFGDGFTSVLANPVHPYTSPGTYTVTLIVSNSTSFNGQPSCPECVDSVQHTVIIDNVAGPDITCIATVCAGDTAKYCTAAAGCGTYTWTVTGGTILSGQNTPCIIVKWGTGSPQGSINLVVTGCPAAACPQGTTVFIPIIPLVGTITGPSPVCEFSSAVYSLPYWPGTIYSWTLPFAGGTISPFNTNTNQVTVNWGAAGNFSVSATYFDSSLNCGGTATFPVLVRPILSINGPTRLCQGSTANFNAFRPGNFPVPSNWSISPAGPVINFGNGTASVNVTWPTAGVFTITASSVNPNATCSPASYIVTVIPMPVISSINGPDSICPNQVYVYTVTSNTTGPYTWSLLNGAPVFLGANNDSVQVTWAGTGPYGISVSQLSFPDNCPSNSLAKNVFPYPTPLLNGNFNVCADNTETYNILNIASGNFQWYITPASFGTIISGQGTSSVTIKWHGNNNPGFVNTVQLHYGVCDADSVAININEPTPAAITASGTLCTGPGVTLSTGATGNFTWTCTEHPVIPTPGNTPSITVNLPGHYQVQIQNYNGTGCTVTATYFIPDVGTPVAFISANNVLNYCLPNLPNMQLVANNAPGYSFQWFLGNTFVGTGQTYNVNTLTMAGTYSYHAVVSLGTCTDTSNIITITIANCPPVAPGPCANAALDVTSITGCNPYTVTVAPTAPPGATLIGNISIFHYEDGTTVNSATTHTYTTTGYHQIRVCADILLADLVTVCRPCKDTVVLVNGAADFTSNVGCGKISLFDASTTIFPAVISNYTWSVGYNPGNGPVPPLIASFNNINIPSPVLTITQTGSYIVSLTIKVGSCFITHRDTFNISVPDADFNISNSCVGTTVNFNNLFPAPVNFWSFGDAATSYTSPTFHAYAVANTYNVTHIVTDANGCKDTVVKAINIVPAPTCNIAYLGPTTFCFGDSLFLNACAGFTNYQWFNNGVAIAGATTAIDTVTQTGNYSFTALSGSGCLLVSDTVSVTVLQPPAVGIAFTGSVCAGSNFAAAVLPCGGCVYQWFVDGNPVSTASQITGTSGIAPYTTGSHTIKVIVTNTSGCSDSSTLVRNFFALPTVSVSVAPNPPFICSNNVYTLTATSNAASPVWGWTLNNLNTILSNTNVLIASAAGAYTIKVTDGITGCSDTAIQNILLSPDLNLFPIGCDTLCDTSHVFLPLPSLNGNLAGYTIQWYDNPPPFITPVGSGISFPLSSLPNGNHNLAVIVTAPNGCKDTSNIYSVLIVPCLNVVAVRQLELRAKQIGSFALLNWSTNAEIDNDHFIAERSTDGIHFVFAGKVKSKGNSNSPQYYQLYDPIKDYNQQIFYRVSSVDINGSLRYSNVVKLNPVKVSDETLQVIPTLTRGPADLLLFSNSFAKTNIMVYAAEGKLVKKIPVTLLKGANRFQIDAGELTPGLYLVAIATNNKQLTATLIKQ